MTTGCDHERFRQIEGLGQELTIVNHVARSDGRLARKDSRGKQRTDPAGPKWRLRLRATRDQAWVRPIISARAASYQMQAAPQRRILM